MRLALVPRTTEFYDLFTRAGQNALEAARLVERRFGEFPEDTVRQSDVKALETAGDDLTREILELLNTQYITPFDREDIYELARAIDDVVDLIEEGSDRLELYGVQSATRHALEQCGLLVAAAECLDRALRELKTPRRTEPELVELKRLEDEGDRIVREAIAALFQDPRVDPLVVIRWKDIYEGLEDALDACERCANVIANIAVKNA